MISQKEGLRRFKVLQEQAYRKMVKKNKDYATPKDFLSNFRESERFGETIIMGVMNRASDKWSRLCNIIKNKEINVKDETLKDTLIDLSNYALLILIASEEK